jgi:hypothetical protein
MGTLCFQRFHLLRFWVLRYGFCTDQNADAEKWLVPRFIRPKGFMNTGNVFYLPGNR